MADLDFGPYEKDIQVARFDMERCKSLVDRNGERALAIPVFELLLIPPDQVHNQEELQRLLENIDMPLRRVNDDLTNITDNLKSKQIGSHFGTC